MEFSFDTQGVHTYLVYKISASEQIDSLTLGMVTNNRIKGIAPVLSTQINTDKYLKYNVSAKVSAAKFLTGAVTKKRILGVFSGIVNAVLAAEEYMIDADMLILDLEYIFVDVSTCEPLLICLPIAGNTRKAGDVSAFFKEIIFSTQYDQTENNDYVAKIISYLNGTTLFALNDFGNMIKQLSNNTNKTEAHGYSSAVPHDKPMLQAVSQAPPKEIPAVNAMQQPQAPVAAKQPSAPPISSAAKKSKGKSKTDSQVMTETSDEEKKKITFLHLMMHYNKENQEAYNAQKKNKADAPAKKKPVSAGEGKFVVPGTETHIQAVTSAQSVTPITVTPAPQANMVVQQAVPTPMQTAAPNTFSGTANFGETTVLNAVDAGATTVLGIDSASAPGVAYLVRTKNNERINLIKNEFRLGKERGFADYFIGDNPAISRSHAEITISNGEYFVTDMNSTNHTYVNDIIIQSSTPMKLSHGARIKLANEEFEFRQT